MAGRNGKTLRSNIGRRQQAADESGFALSRASRVDELNTSMFYRSALTLPAERAEPGTVVQCPIDQCGSRGALAV
jgi:hypothetical protein